MAEHAPTHRDALFRDVAARFGLLPNFFASSAAPLALVENLWAFARAAYLDSPLPPLFKERLLVRLSRFCEARYCVVRHVGFLLGDGWVAGDPETAPQTIEDVLALLRRPAPDARGLKAAIERLRAGRLPAEIAAPGSQTEADLFDALTAVFVDPLQSRLAFEAVREAVGPERLEVLTALLAFARTAHFWTETHDEIAPEADVQALLSRNPELASLLLDLSEAKAAQSGAALREALAELSDARAEIGGEPADLQAAIRALRESETKYRGLFEAIDAGFCIIEVLVDEAGAAVDYLFLEANPAFAAQTGLADAVGRRIRDIAPAHEDFWFETYGRIARTGAPERFEHRADALDRWYDVFAFPVGEPGERRVAVLFDDVKERKRAEEVLRESEERQTFLLLLSDALRLLDEPASIFGEACRLVAEHLDVARAYYVEVDDDAGVARVQSDSVRNGAASLSGEHRVADCDRSFAILRSGESHVLDDVRTSSLVPEDERSALIALDIVSSVGAPLIKAGRLVGALCVTDGRPRSWTLDEVSIVSDVAERLWATIERARAETAQRLSEERFRQFGDASSTVLWIRNARTLKWEYLTPAFETIYGLSRDAALSGDTFENWLDLILPEDRERAEDYIRRVGEGEFLTFEYRIRRADDGAVRWLRNTDFPLRDAEGRVERIGGIGEDVTETRELAGRMKVLVAELQHRTRNLMAVVQALATETSRTSGTLEQFGVKFSERLAALARVQGLLSRLDEGDRVPFDAVIETELSAVGAERGPKVSFEGPAGVRLRSSTLQTLSLAIHELATNAVKHGALSRSQDEGRLSVTWRLVERDAVEPASDGATTPQGGGRRLRVDWVESGVALPAGEGGSQSGFGRELIEQALPFQLGAATRYEIAEDGVRCTIVLPVSESAS